MRFVVDANIVFSGILNTNGKIGDLLINSGKIFEFIAPDYLRFEIREKYPKIVKVSGMTFEQVQEAEFQIYRHLNFISEEQLSIKTWQSSEKLVSDIDPKDISYIALSKHFKCIIWSGDKALMNGLGKKGFLKFITTEELYQLKIQLVNKKSRR